MIINGVLSLSRSILCKSEVLGQSFNASLSGIKVNIHFPVLPEIEDSKGLCEYGLLPPEIGVSWKKTEDRTFWGYPLIYPPGNSCVNKLVFTVDCNNNLVEDTAMILYTSIKKWERVFVDYIILETKQGTDRERNEIEKSCELLLFTDKRIPENKAYTIHIHVPGLNEYASKDCIQAAIGFASSGKELMLEHQMLLSAYDARIYNQNLRAILDACSAMELCLVNSIKEFCKTIGLDSRILLKSIVP